MSPTTTARHRFMSASASHHASKGLIALSRRQTAGEEVANAISHGTGLVAALTGAPLLIVAAAQARHPAMLVGACVFAGAILLTYLCSTLYHALPHGRGKQWLRLLDHLAIFLLIAGSYTPFTLGVLKGAWGWALFGTVWALAVAGMVLKITGGIRHPRLSTGLYLVMGWLVLAAAQPLWERMPFPALLWLAAGGLAYTAGVPFFAADERMRFGHFVWHLFVLAGTTCHFMAVFHCV
ncbi:MAG: hemolysin III family protein [Akkermansiaceae bacterium]|nr:hemolysin III family protein [Akkermansiaceae bacterium]